MRIKIVLKQPYPIGFASTNRVHLYAKGMVEAGHEVDIFIPIPPSENSYLKNDKVKGHNEGITYHYTANRTKRSTSFIGRRLHDIWGVFNAGIQLFRDRRHSHALILISTEPFHILFFRFIANISKLVYLTECNEYPFVFNTSGSIRSSRWFQKFYIKRLISLYDGLIVISNNLKSFYEEQIGDKVSYALIPVLVDCQEFTSIPANKESYVAYAGNLSQDKDGLYTQLEAFAQASRKFPELKFYIIGKAQRQQTKEKADEIIKELKIQDKVIFTGFISRKKLVSIFRNASALMLYKPDSIQAEYCFPSKTAEYLASGSPVVTTSTGELKNYLTHEISALLSDPNDKEALASNLIKVLSDVNLAKRISENGYEIASNNFDYHVQSQNIINFISELRSKKIPKYSKKEAKTTITK
ncbi:glycosyltransferase involved in cell wall biosynthesis [Catalinimonas alkaloidigena]|uniref:glycosyltransferase family 4 protein n=1 Tax=Catalinimonas alkaloidigena TaxID=1075417 RepID=UPI002406B475|nr:glycosyltransferase family 4 protein [Catalinimonas alkaloidigena]MDF9796750.1 glycosyltransferase involved in cell wall biosynthesis [Catalinimonas alkaloidigena]